MSFKLAANPQGTSACIEGLASYVLDPCSTISLCLEPSIQIMQEQDQSP